MTARAVRPYQRRRPGPVAAVVVVLAVLASVTWAAVLVNAGSPGGKRACPPPASGQAPGTALAPDALDAVVPVAPNAVKATVLNAGGQRGQANLVAAQLGDLGFGQAAAPGNDPLYPTGDMDCTGQLRFGPAGEQAASTLALVVPCAQLVRDDRTDATVDVAVGQSFGDLNPVRAVRDALEQLAAPPAAGDGTANADPANPDAGPAPPAVDPALLQEARAAC